MKSERMNNSVPNASKRQVHTAVPLVLASGFFAAGLLLFAGQSASAQETTIAPETTVVATDTTLVAGDVVTGDSIAVEDSTPVGGLETGFGGTASGSNSNQSGLYLAGAAGIAALGALGLRKVTKQSSPRGDRQQSN